MNHAPPGRRRARTLVTAIMLALVAAVGLGPATAGAAPTTGTIDGTVTLPAGLTWSGVIVHVVLLESETRNELGDVQMSDATFAFDGLAPGTYELQFYENDGKIGHQLVTSLPITGNETDTVTITLSRGTTANGRILLPTGGPDGTASFVVAQSEAGTSVSEVRADGTYSLVGLGRAIYTVLVYHGPAQLPTIYLGSTYRRATASALRVDAFGATVTVPAIDWRTPVFTDVASIRKFSYEIGWLLDEGVTSGYPDGSFRPLGSVNRDAMAAFLYRIAGRPEFTPPATSPFTDVPTTSQFYKEVTWLAAEGISTGWPDHTFRPSLPVKRDAMAAFLYRLQGMPTFTPPTTSPFTDVPRTSQFYKEITWLAASEISTGWPDHTFRPQLSVARDAMAAFLFRSRPPWASTCASPQSTPQPAHAAPSRDAMVC